MADDEETRLVQTRVKPWADSGLRQAADAEGISVAAYVRRLIYKDLNARARRK